MRYPSGPVEALTKIQPWRGRGAEVVNPAPWARTVFTANSTPGPARRFSALTATLQSLGAGLPGWVVRAARKVGGPGLGWVASGSRVKTSGAGAARLQARTRQSKGKRESKRLVIKRPSQKETRRFHPSRVSQFESHSGRRVPACSAGGRWPRLAAQSGESARGRVWPGLPGLHAARLISWCVSCCPRLGVELKM